MSSSTTDQCKLTVRQGLFVTWYIKLLNATRAAQRAGYEGNNDTLRQVGSENLAKPYIRAEIDRQLKASIPSANEVLTRIAQRAHADITPYLDAGMRLDVQAMAADGLGHLVKGVKPGREGVEITLVDPQTATKNLARYHRILGADTQVDITNQLTANEDTLAALAQQIAAAQQSTAQQDDTPE